MKFKLLHLWVLACYLFIYGGLSPLLTASPLQTKAAPLAKTWAKAGTKGMACGSKKGLICVCAAHGKGQACCCAPKQASKGLAWNAAPCGQSERPSLAAFGSHFQTPFPAQALLPVYLKTMPQLAYLSLSGSIFSDAPEKIPRS